MPIYSFYETMKLGLLKFSRAGVCLVLSYSLCTCCHITSHYADDTYLYLSFNHNNWVCQHFPELNNNKTGTVMDLNLISLICLLKRYLSKERFQVKIAVWCDDDLSLGSSVSSGPYGECDGVGGGCDRERRALPEWCQRSASQIHQRVCPRAANHHVAPGGAEEPSAFYTNSTTPTLCQRERDRRIGGEKKERKKVFFLFVFINLDLFLALLGCTVHKSEMKSIWSVKKQPGPSGRFTLVKLLQVKRQMLISWMWQMINVSRGHCFNREEVMDGVMGLGWLCVRWWRD